MEEPEMTLEELRESLLAHFADAGVLSSVKAQLRRHFLDSMKDLGSDAEERELNLPESAVYSLILNHLQRKNLPHSVAVFLPESGLSRSDQLSNADALQILGYSSDAKVFAEQDSGKSVLEILLEEAKTSKKSEATQTSISAEDHLRAQLRSLEKKFEIASEEMDTENLDKKLSVYMRQMDERAAQEAKEMFERWRGQELLKMEMDLRAQKTREVDLLRRELQNDYSARLEGITKREEERLKRAENEVRSMEAASYDHRQKLLLELERLRNRESEGKRLLDVEKAQLERERRENKDHERRLQARETAVNRKEVEVGLRAAEAAKLAKIEAIREYEQRSDAIAAERRFLEEQREALEAERRAVQGQLQSHQACQRDLATREADLVSMTVQVREMEAQLDQQRRVMAEQQAELQAKEDDALAAVAAAAKLPVTFSGIGADLDPSKLTPLMVSKLSLVALRAQAEHRCEELKAELAALRDEVRKERERRDAAVRDVEQKKEVEWHRAETLKTKCEHLETELFRAQDDVERAVADAEELRMEAQGLRSENARLAGMIEHLKQMLTDHKMQPPRRGKLERASGDFSSGRENQRPKGNLEVSQAYQSMKQQVREDRKAGKRRPKRFHEDDADATDDDDGKEAGREVAPTKTAMDVLERILKGVQGLAAKEPTTPKAAGRPSAAADSAEALTPSSRDAAAAKAARETQEARAKARVTDDAAALVRQARQEAELFRHQSEVTLQEVRMRSAAVRDWEELVRERLKLAQEDVNLRSRLSLSMQQSLQRSFDSTLGRSDSMTQSDGDVRAMSSSLEGFPRRTEPGALLAIGRVRPDEMEPRESTNAGSTDAGNDAVEDARIAKAEQDVEDLKRTLRLQQEDHLRLQQLFEETTDAPEEAKDTRATAGMLAKAEPEGLYDDERLAPQHVESKVVEAQPDHHDASGAAGQGPGGGALKTRATSKEAAAKPEEREPVRDVGAGKMEPAADKAAIGDQPTAPSVTGASTVPQLSSAEMRQKQDLPPASAVAADVAEEAQRAVGEVSSPGRRSEEQDDGEGAEDDATKAASAPAEDQALERQRQLEEAERAAEEAARRKKAQEEAQAREQKRREEELRQQKEDEDAGLRELREQRERVRLRRKKAREEEEKRLAEERKRKEDMESRAREEQQARVAAVDDDDDDDDDEEELDFSTGTKSGSNEYDESGSTTSGYF